MAVKTGKSTGAIALNRQARRNYEILETFEAGLVLSGSEIKSIRDGRVNITQAFAQERGGEMWLVNAHVAEYKGAGNKFTQHEPTQDRKLLLRRKQIRHMMREMTQQRITVVPLRLFIRNHYAKIELGIARGRRQYDKRAHDAERSTTREIQRATKLEAR
jgi:SsrA-binding protein